MLLNCLLLFSCQQRVERLERPPRLVPRRSWIAPVAQLVSLDASPGDHDAVVGAVFRRRKHCSEPFFLCRGLQPLAQVLIRRHAATNDLPTVIYELVTDNPV